MAKRRSYTEEEKRSAVAAHVVHGTLTGASKQSGIPYQTIQRWKTDHSTWWEKIAAEIWEQEGEKIRSRYGQIVDLGSIALIDRIEHGDTRVNTKGELYRIPVSGKDMTIMVGTFQDKLNVMQGKPTSISAVAGQSITEKLESLKQTALKQQDELKQEAIDRGDVVNLRS